MFIFFNDNFVGKIIKSRSIYQLGIGLLTFNQFIPTIIGIFHTTISIKYNLGPSSFESGKKCPSQNLDPKNHPPGCITQSSHPVRHEIGHDRRKMLQETSDNKTEENRPPLKFNFKEGLFSLLFCNRSIMEICHF